MIYRLFLITALALWASVGHAASNNGNLSVSAVIPPQVIVISGILNFGTASDPLALLSATGTFQVMVTAGTNYNITLDAGLNSATERRMADGKGFFRPYHLYHNAAHTIQWGDNGYANTFSAGSAKSALGTGNNQSYSVYGISPSQNRAVNPNGTYTDIVTITVHY